jgi:hypothetical protein
MQRIFQCSGRRQASRAANDSTAITDASTVTLDTTDSPQSFPLPLLEDDFFWEATIVRSAIVGAVDIIRSTEQKCKEDHANGHQTAAQLEVRSQVHRNQVQRLAQLGNRHAQLCYNFEHRELISGLVDGYEDPTCRRAVRGCFAEITNLRPVLDHNDTCLHAHHPLVVPIISKWFSPSLGITEDDFHAHVWIHGIAPSWQDAGVIVSPRLLDR